MFLVEFKQRKLLVCYNVLAYFENIFIKSLGDGEGYLIVLLINNFFLKILMIL